MLFIGEDLELNNDEHDFQAPIIIKDIVIIKYCNKMTVFYYYRYR